MPISVSCEGCGSKFRAPDKAAGHSVKCPKCGNRLQVPTTEKQPDAILAELAEPDEVLAELAEPEPVEDDPEFEPSASSPDSSSHSRLRYFGVGLGFGIGGVLIFLLVVAVIFLWTARKGKAEAAEATKALERIKAAAEVGVTLQQYNQLVIDAKAAVNEAERVLPQGELSTNLTEAMTAYKDALTVWDCKIHSRRILFREEDGLGDIVARYKLPSREWEPGNLEKKGEIAVYFDVAMQIIWKVGAEKLAKARSLQ